jgi:cytochrome c-type biogenesis protein
MEESISLLAAFGAGFLSFISPCVLPVVPGYLSFVSGASMEELSGGGATTGRRWAIMADILAFVLGFSVVFIILGASATALGAFFLSKMSILSKIAGVLVIVLGLHMLGVFRFTALYKEKRFQARTKRVGVLGSFLIGVAFAFGWSPCIGPILGGILAYASTEETVTEGMMLLASYSLGLGIPFIVAGLSLDAFFRWTGRFKRHFRAIEVVSGVLLLTVGVLILTNQLSVLSFWIADKFPWLNEIG